MATYQIPGGNVTVDEQDAHLLVSYPWRVQVHRKHEQPDRVWVCAYTKIEGKWTSVRLHVMILGPRPRGHCAAWRDGDRCNCSRQNLYYKRMDGRQMVSSDAVRKRGDSIRLSPKVGHRVVLVCDCGCNREFQTYASRRPKSHKFYSRDCYQRWRKANLGRVTQADVEREDHPSAPMNVVYDSVREELRNQPARDSKTTQKKWRRK